MLIIITNKSDHKNNDTTTITANDNDTNNVD